MCPTFGGPFQLAGPWAFTVGVGYGWCPLTSMFLQESGKLEEVMQELRALRVLVKEQGERISRLEEQLGRMENGDT